MAGIVAGCSARISGFVTYAVASVVLGEDRLEGQGGMTGLGWIAFGLPALVGVGLVLWSFVSDRAPRMRTAAVVSAVIAAAFLVLGLGSISASADDGDASIGGGLLVFASVPIAIGSAVLFRATRPRSS